MSFFTAAFIFKVSTSSPAPSSSLELKLEGVVMLMLKPLEELELKVELLPVEVLVRENDDTSVSGDTALAAKSGPKTITSHTQC